jgi:signal peptidase I
MSSGPLTIPPRSPSSSESITTHGQVEGAIRPDAPPSEMGSGSNENFIVEIFKFSILALVIVIPFRFFIAQPFIVSGASMSPTFETGEYLIVDQVSYRLHEPQRGDVIVFKYPNDPSKYFIKRIIGLPGEVVELANGVTTIRNPGTNESVVLAEPYIKKDLTDDHLAITLSSDEYFVLGDNRGASSDSRVWGPVPKKNLVGRALVRLLPPDSFGVLPGAYVQHLEFHPATSTTSQ